LMIASQKKNFRKKAPEKQVRLRERKCVA